MNWQELGKELFGEGLTKVNMAGLSRETGINRKTLDSYKDNPNKIPLGRLKQICDAIGVQLHLEVTK